MNYLSPQKSLNKIFLKSKINSSDFTNFQENLQQLITQIDSNESEEFNKYLLINFLQDTYYRNKYFINTKDNSDLVIHKDKNNSSPVNVIFETKNIKETKDFPSLDDINCKALQQLLLYYLHERIINKNLEVKHLIITNNLQWFIFNSQIFEKYFAQDKNLVANFIDFEEKRLSIKNTVDFYKEIAQPIIENVKDNLIFTFFNLEDYQKLFNSNNREDKRKLIALYKIFSPEYLLKLPFANDSNSLEQKFYNELLYILGLKEVKKGNKKLIERETLKNRNKGSLLENIIIKIKSLDKISRINKIEEYGKSEDEQLFNLALELVITWINRILFLKLLEAQLINYNYEDKSQDYRFLSIDKIKNYDELNNLFFQVLACKFTEREDFINQRWGYIPYLNSSLFEVTQMEHQTIVISNLSNENIPIFKATILKDNNGKKLKGELNALEYLFNFLDAYDFSTEGNNQIQEENKNLINASVLGLIFEKINGYQDGSFFTPGFITMYICRETIRHSIIDKFNDIKGWNCQTIEDLYDKIDDKTEANQIINSLKICDPAVGSGHFLVSALNEMIAIKSELKILLDREGKTLRDYEIIVENDELIILDDNGNFFEYNPNNKESQRVQETLFHQKQTIIENCLFGVDINNNSVKICRLRLWIELLKNAYYLPSPLTPFPQERGRRQLETLPNIDINIKCGNSLISRFDKNSNLKGALRKSNCDIATYQNAVKTYHNAENKEQKREMFKLIKNIKRNFQQTLFNTNYRKVKLRNLEGELYNLENQLTLLEETKKQKKAREKKINKLNNEIDKLNVEIGEIENGKLYQNAFEWRFEFPEILNNKGDFIGFDIIIGNPPYGVKLNKREQNFYKENYEFSTSETAILFVKKAWDILNKKGKYSYIIPKSYTFASNYEKIRNFTFNNLTDIVDCGKVWQDVKLEVCIFIIDKNLISTQYNCHKLINFTISKQSIINKNITQKFGFILNSLTEKEILIGLKILENFQTLNDISVNHRGAIIQKLICENGDGLVIGGANIQRYFIKGIKGKIDLKKVNNEKAFIKPNSILVQRIVSHIQNPYDHIKITASLPDNNNYLLVDTINQITINNKFYPQVILSILNSTLINWYVYRFIFAKAIRTMQFDNPTTSKIPIPKFINNNVQQIIFEKVNTIIKAKKDNLDANTSKLEQEIDKLVYKLYELTEEEIKIVEEYYDD